MKHIKTLKFNEFINESLTGLTPLTLDQVKHIDSQVRKAAKANEIGGDSAMANGFKTTEDIQTIWHIDSVKGLGKLLVNYWIIDEGDRQEAAKKYSKNIYILCNYDPKTGEISNPRGEEAWKHSRSEMNKWGQVWHNRDGKNI